MDGLGDGAAYVFSDGPSGWSQEAKRRGKTQGFRYTVALDGATAAVANIGNGAAGFVTVTPSHSSSVLSSVGELICLPILISGQIGEDVVC